ncbi:DMT family transporter [Candidatus Woesearchaeota archaeon]|nr:DMT family transporter [Candidatus Woesearchaeota archaeon]
MAWFGFALLAAFSESLNHVFSKKGLKHVDEFAASWGMRFFAALLLLPAIFIFHIPEIKPVFWIALAIGAPLYLAAQVLFMKSIKDSDLSITAPFVTFTPLFLLVTSPLIVHEFPPVAGILGISLVVLGAYVLQIKEFHKGYLAPFKALFKEPGPRLMLIVAFIWSITSNIDKIGVANSSPIFWAFSLSLMMVILLAPIILIRQKSKVKAGDAKHLFPIGVASAFTLIFQFTAISMALVAYVIAIKRASSVLSVAWGHFVFKEKNVRERIAGAAIMVAGVLLIAFSH